MQTANIKEYLIFELRKLNRDKENLLMVEIKNENWTSLKLEVQQNLNRLKRSSKVYVVVAYVLLAITGVVSFMKVLDIPNTPDLNKGALLVMLTVTNAIVAFSQKIRIGQLEKQLLLIHILDLADRA